MKTPVLLTLFSAAIFIAMILNLAAKPRFTRGLSGIFCLLAGIGGLIFYGMGFAMVLDDPLLAVMRTLLAVSRMYAGVNDLSAISAAPILSSRFALAVFWMLHLMAFYAMASATISALGASALKRLRFWLQRYGKSVILYGVNGDAVDFARDLIAHGERNIVLVGDKPDKSCEAAASEAGCLVRSDASALNPGIKFLKSLGAEKGTPELTLYALDGDSEKNLSYATALLSALEAAGVCTDKTRLVLRCSDDSVECPLVAGPDHAGYGSVMSFTSASLAGRLLMKRIPPCRKMSFRSDGTAEGDFDAVIVGFGRTGRNVLRNLVRNAQFEGSHFRAAVFATDVKSQSGYFLTRYPALIENYDIRLCPEAAGSLAFYDYLREHAATLRYLVLCTGNGSKSELHSEITAYLTSLGSEAAVCVCAGKDVFWSETPTAPLCRDTVLSYDVLCADSMDALASRLNYSYVNDSSITPEEAWSRCDYFSRESSRASADFLPAFLRISGLTEENSPDDWQSLSPVLLENMARTEHRRWCAFHYSMGFTAMEEADIRQRGEKYLAMKAAGNVRPLRIGKDIPGRRHACLRPWEELDALSELEMRYTGVFTDYKDMDLRNVLAAPVILRDGGKG